MNLSFTEEQEILRSLLGFSRWKISQESIASNRSQ